jgi:uncharacterized protein (DUF1697 family)
VSADRRIALLRGINLAGKRRVSMAALRELLDEAGYEEVRTHLRSGNVVLTSRVPAARLGKDLTRLISSGLGLDVDVIVRTRAELAKVVAADPLGKVVDNPSRYQVTFLEKAVSPKVARELAAADVAPEQVAVKGREIYAWHPDGLQRSKLAALLTDRRLGGTATARNWNTVTRLLELADE